MRLVSSPLASNPQWRLCPSPDTALGATTDGVFRFGATAFKAGPPLADDVPREIEVEREQCSAAAAGWLMVYPQGAARPLRCREVQSST